MVSVSDQSVARATCDRASPFKKVVARGAGQTKGRIQLKLGGLIATLGRLNWGEQRWRLHHTCEMNVNSDFIMSVLAEERLV